MKPTELKRLDWIKYNTYFVFEHFLGYKTFQKFFGKASKELYFKIEQSISRTEPKAMEPPSVTGEEIYKNIKNYKKLLKGPVLFKGAAKNWESCKNWDLEYFEKNYGEKEIILNDLIGTVDPNNPQTFQKVSLKEYIGLLKDGSLKYLKFSSLVQDEEVLQKQLDQEWLHNFDKPGSFGKVYYMFIGGNGTITPMHNEFPSVVYAQISGRKKWIIYMPEDRVFLDPRTERRTYFYTNADPKKVADENYPLFKYAKRYEFILEPGDVLWFPPFAWHYVENLSESIGVAYKFANIGLSLKSSKVLTTLFFMATKPNLFVKFFASRLFKKDYVVSKSQADSD